MSNQELVTIEQVAEEPKVTEATTAEAPIETESVEIEAEVVSTPAEESASEDVAEEETPPAEDTTEEDTDALSIHSLTPGQHLQGKVKNITDFGAFVDIGLPQDGLVHISEVSKKKVEKVTDVVSEGDELDIWVKKIDTKRGRISLTMVKPISLRLRAIAEEAELDGTITRLESYGAFVDIGSERDGLVHISQITYDYINHPEDTLTIGDAVKVKVIKVNRKKRQVDLSIKALLPPPVKEEVVEEIIEEEEVVEVSEDKPAPTAMALAYAAMQSKNRVSDPGKDTGYTKGKRKRKKEMNDIVARTLATSE